MKKNWKPPIRLFTDTLALSSGDSEGVWEWTAVVGE